MADRHSEIGGLVATRRQFLTTVSAGAATCMALPATAADPATATVPATATTDGPAIYRMDFDRCEPQSALAREAQPHHWRLLDFESDVGKGVMLVAGQNTAAPEISYPLNLTGWHSISFGLRSAYGDTEVQVKLTADSTFTILTHRVEGAAKDRVDDVFWKAADLSGQSIVFLQLCIQTVPENPDSIGNACSGAWIAYIKLVPLSDADVEQMLADQKSGATRTLFAHNDAWSDHYRLRPTTADEIRRMIEPYRDTDFAALFWEGCQGDRCNYFTKIGLMPTDEASKDPYRVGDRLAAESWRILREKQIDPFQVAVDYTHEIGLEFHGALRTSGFHFPVPEDTWTAGGAYDRHPEWQGVDRLGRSTPRLSYAFPEFRRYVISLLQEMATYPIDGVCLLFNRRPPFLEYEAPVVESFQRDSGMDPRQLDERDPRWLKHRALTMTLFMQEVRAAMNESARQSNRTKPISISAIVMSTQAENLYYGLDLKAWIREKTVDMIVPYTSVPKLLSTGDSWVDPQEAEYFLQLTEGTLCKLALNMMPRQLPAETYNTRAHRLYHAGAQHLFFWDTNGRHDFSANWSALRRLGHKDEISAWVQSGSPAIPRPGATLTKLGDWDLTYATPG